LNAALLALALVQAQVAKPPRVHHWPWPGAVTNSPRPLPGASEVPLRTTLFLEVEPGTTSDGAFDELDVATLELTLTSAAPQLDARPLVEHGAPTAAAARVVVSPSSAQESLALYVEPAQPLLPDRVYDVAVTLRSKSGLSVDSGSSHWSFSTRGSPEETTLELSGDASRVVHFEQRVFSGTLKPNFDTTELLRQVATDELASSVVGPPPHPNGVSLERDWPLCGDYFTNDFFDGDPNLVRERETRRVTKIVDVAPGTAGHELELTLADLPEGPLYGIAKERPLAPDFPLGSTVLLVDDAESYELSVTRVDDATRTIRVSGQQPRDLLLDIPVRRPEPPGFLVDNPRMRELWWQQQFAATHPMVFSDDCPRAAEVHLFEPPVFPPDSAAVPGHFASRITRLVKLDPPGTPVFWFGRLDHEWDMVHRRFGRRLVVGFDRTPCDLSQSGVVNCVEGPKDWREWQQVVGAIVSHLIERYGKSCLDFHWSVFNEPDLRPLFWASDDATLFAFYDVTVDAILGAFEGHGLPSDPVRVGGLELGALAAEPDLLPRFLVHCSREPNFLSASSNDGAADRPHFCSRRARELAERRNGCGSPCDFLSLHEYKHAAFALHQLRWARRTALAVDRELFRDLAVVAFESDPDWNPNRDPATREMFLGNGFWPAWAADWTRRAIDAAFVDPAFERHEALLTIWPLDQDLVGIPTLSTVLERRSEKGSSFVTVPKDVLHFLELVGSASTDYFRLGARSPKDAASGVDSTVSDPDDPRPRPVVAGFGARRSDGLDLLVYGHDPLDPEVRDAHERTVHLVVRGAGREPGSVTSYALDANSCSFFATARELAHDGAPLAASDVDRLTKLARLEPQPTPPSIASKNGAWELELVVPSNGIRFVRVNFATK
jgi:hypothetical protein